MSRVVTAREAKAKLLALLDEVALGEEVEITKHGRTVARLVPGRGPNALKGLFAGRAWTTDPNDDLLSADIEWEMNE